MSISCVVQEREVERAMNVLHADLFADPGRSVEDVRSMSDTEQTRTSGK